MVVTTVRFKDLQRGWKMSDNTKRGLVFAALLLVILFALGLRIDHPKSGLRNALGSASSSVAVYWHNSEISVGERIVVNTGKPGLDPVLAIVNNVNTDDVDIQTDDGFQRVPREDVQGSLVMVFPFLGALLGFVGL
jgi:hypothetical protein